MAGEKVISGNMRLTLGGKTIYHATEASLSLSREFKERATKDTNGTERAKGKKSWTASSSALGAYGGDGVATNDFFALFDLYNNDDDVPILIEFVPDETDAEFKLVGNGFIESLEKNLPNEEDSTVSISIVGSGAMAKEAIPVA